MKTTRRRGALSQKSLLFYWMYNGSDVPSIAVNVALMKYIRAAKPRTTKTAVRGFCSRFAIGRNPMYAVPSCRQTPGLCKDYVWLSQQWSVVSSQHSIARLSTHLVCVTLKACTAQSSEQLAAKTGTKQELSNATDALTNTDVKNLPY